MKKVFLKSILLLCALIVGSTSLWGQSDKSTDYTGNVTLSTSGGSNASNCKVNISGTEYNGIKAGTGSNAGAVRISVPSGTKYLHMHVAAWNGESVSLSISPNTYSGTTSIALTADAGVKSNTPFTLSSPAKAPTDYYKVLTFTNALNANTNITFTATGAKRFVIWGVTAETVSAYNISASANDASYGSVEVSGSTIIATPNPGYRVISGDGGYTLNEGTATITNNGNNTFSVTATSDCNITINFEEIPKYSVTFDAPTGGSLVIKNGDEEITSGDKFYSGTQLEIIVEADENYVFSNWQYKKGEGNWNTRTTTFDYTMDANDVIIKANFTATHLVSWIINGTTASTSRIVEGEKVPLIKAPTYLNNKRFVGWSASPILGETSDEPTILSDNLTMSNSDIPYYAVYADVTNETPATCVKMENLNSFSSSDILVIVGNNENTFALSNNNGTSNAPAAISVTVEGSNITSEISEEILWNVAYESGDGKGYIFYPNGTTKTWLYNTNTNNGVRVGTGDGKYYVINSGYLKNTSNNRYVGIYNSSDWRCYTSTTGTSNIKDQTFDFYKYTPAVYTYDNYCTSVSSMTVSLGANQWATYSFSMDVVVPSNARLKVYKAKVNLAGDALDATVIPAGSNIIAGEGLLLKATVADNYTFDRVTSGDVSAQAKNQLKGVLVATSADVLKAQNGDCEYIMVLNKNTGEFGSFTGTFPANRAYIPYTAPTNAPSAFRIVEEVENATDMKSLDANEGIVKFIKNGQIYIIREGVVYDALGRIVK